MSQNLRSLLGLVYASLTTDGSSWSFGDLSTVFQAHGVLICNANIVANSSRGIPINICTDSQRAIKAMEGSRFNSVLVLECREIHKFRRSTTCVKSRNVSGKNSH